MLQSRGHATVFQEAFLQKVTKETKRLVLARTIFPGTLGFAFDDESPTPLRSLLFKTMDRAV
jgi:hypothetical protein